MKVNLLDYPLPKLEEFFVSLSEKKFRAKQVFRWLHVYGATNFEQMTDIAKSLKERLTKEAEIKVPKIFSESQARDEVVKWVLALEDGNKIETVFIPEKNRGTLCISSQVGCALECQFCSTARQGFNRNLTSGEIVGQLWLAKKRLAEINPSQSITNVVMMGMGEPLANYENVVNAISIMLDDNAYNLSKKKLTLSTSGIVPALLRLKDSANVALALSLHAPNNQIRDQIVPINKKYPLEELLPACKEYLKSSSKEFVTFEYVMLKGVNDSIKCANELVKLIHSYSIPCKFNLIPFNPFPNSGFESSNMEQILQFQKILQIAGFITTIRKTRGEQIDAACGQLVGKVRDKTKRQEKWSKFIPLTSV